MLGIDEEGESLMKSPFKFLLLSALALLMAVPAALAQTPEASVLPVTEPLDVGGTILQPGTYLIRVLPTKMDRNKVQITDMDRSKVYATLLTVPHPLEPNEEVPASRFIFYPPENGHPLALRTWFAADPVASQGGHDIVYEEGRARVLARVADAPVVYYPEETTVEQLETAPLAIVTPQETVEVYVPPPPPRVVLAPPPPPVIEVPPPPMISQVTEMPETASNLPLMALLGVIALAGAVLLRVARQ
jgi:hypothetical protein